MGMKENINFALTTIKYITSNSRVIPFGGLLIPGQKFDFWLRFTESGV